MTYEFFIKCPNIKLHDDLLGGSLFVMYTHGWMTFQQTLQRNANTLNNIGWCVINVVLC